MSKKKIKDRQIGKKEVKLYLQMTDHISELIDNSARLQDTILVHKIVSLYSSKEQFENKIFTL